MDKGGSDIYEMFRKNKEIKGNVDKPTGKKDKSINIRGTYKIDWNPVLDKLQYFIIDINR